MNLVTYNGQLVTSNGNAITADISSMLPSGIGCVDLGSLNWAVDSTYQQFYANVNSISGMPAVGVGTAGLCEKYIVNTASIDIASLPNLNVKISWNRYSSSNKYIVIKDTNYSDTTAFKNSLQGVLLFYKKA